MMLRSAQNVTQLSADASGGSSTDPFVAVPCHRCGYDVRMQPINGVCPECEGSVATSRELAKIPVRPRWRDSDPRWRRRMLAGVWVILMLPLVAWLQTLDEVKRLWVPTFYDVQGGQDFHGTFFVYVYDLMLSSMGVVLLFSRERGRQKHRLDWTQRWGVVATYGVLLLGAIERAFIVALVLTGIGAMFIARPPMFQPRATELFVAVGGGYLRHGIHPGLVSDTAFEIATALVVMLACAPLYEALRSAGPRAVAMILLAPLLLAGVIQIGMSIAHASGLVTPEWSHGLYFDPTLFRDAPLFGGTRRQLYYLEWAKWLSMLSIALWLSVAQVVSWFRRRERSSIV